MCPQIPLYLRGWGRSVATAPCSKAGVILHALFFDGRNPISWELAGKSEPLSSPTEGHVAYTALFLTSVIMLSSVSTLTRSPSLGDA